MAGAIPFFPGREGARGEWSPCTKHCFCSGACGYRGSGQRYAPGTLRPSLQWDPGIYVRNHRIVRCCSPALGLTSGTAFAEKFGLIIGVRMIRYMISFRRFRITFSFARAINTLALVFRTNVWDLRVHELASTNYTIDLTIQF